MKLLLTSAGIKNNSIRNALVDLLGKPIAESNALFIPTAIYPFPGGGSMAWEAICGKHAPALSQLGWKSIGLLELTALPGIDKKAWVPAVEAADALLFWGGDPVFLSYWMAQSGLAKLLQSTGTAAVYVGVSAGSMAASATFGETFRDPPGSYANSISAEPIEFDTPDGEIKRTLVTAQGVALVDFALIPHFNHPSHPDASMSNAEKWAARLSVPVYAIDDDTAIKVNGAEIEVISEGQWKLFNF